MQKKTIVHLHLPKTGGQTFGHRISTSLPLSDSYFMEGSLFHPQDVDKFSQLLKNKKFISTHIYGPLLANRNDIDVVSIVRDPIEQIISSYLHARNEKNNILFKHLNILNFEKALISFKEYFSNVQIIKFISALNFRHTSELFSANERYLMSKLYQSVNSVRWLACTDDLDHFSSLFLIENGLVNSKTDISMNIGDKYSEIRSKMRNFLLENSQFYIFDKLFYDEAKRRFQEYKNDLLRSRFKIMKNVDLADSFFAFHDVDRFILLEDGWLHPILTTGHGFEFRSNPSNLSKINFKRRTEDKYIIFDLTYTCGNELDSFIFLNSDKTLRLENFWITSSEKVSCKISISNLGYEGEIFIFVPNLLPKFLYTDDYTDQSIIPFSTINWRFSKV